MHDKIWTNNFAEDALISAELGTWSCAIEIDSDAGLTEAVVRIKKSSTYGPLLLVLAGHASRHLLDQLHSQSLQCGYLVTASFAGDASTLLHTEPFQTLAEGVDEMLVEESNPPIHWPQFRDPRYRRVSKSNLNSEAADSMKSLGLIQATERPRHSINLKNQDPGFQRPAF